MRFYHYQEKDNYGNITSEQSNEYGEESFLCQFIILSLVFSLWLYSVFQFVR